MAVTLIPPGPNASQAAVLKSFYDALSELQIPGGPQQLAHVALKADLPAADDHRGGYLICDEINSIVHSTVVTGAYAWRRADGTAL